MTRAVAHRVAVMQHGRIVETAETETLFAQPTHLATQDMLTAPLTTPPTRAGARNRAKPCETALGSLSMANDSVKEVAFRL